MPQITNFTVSIGASKMFTILSIFCSSAKEFFGVNLACLY